METSAALGDLSILIGGVAYLVCIALTTQKRSVQPYPFSWLSERLVSRLMDSLRYSNENVYLHRSASSACVSFLPSYAFRNFEHATPVGK